MKAFVFGVVLTVGLIVLIWWIDPEPSPTVRDCVEDHTFVAIVPIYNGKTTTWVPQVHTVCDRWSDPYPNPAHAKWLARQKEKHGREGALEVPQALHATGSVDSR